jgi:F420-0:gamma-glutamyl ligase
MFITDNVVSSYEMRVYSVPAIQRSSEALSTRKGSFCRELEQVRRESDASVWW